MSEAAIRYFDIEECWCDESVVTGSTFSITVDLLPRADVTSHSLQKEPNRLTRQTFEDTDNGTNVVRCSDEEDFFRKLNE